MDMTLEILKSEAVKLEKLELLDFAQFIIEALKEKEKIDASGFQLSKPQKMEIQRRMTDVENNLTAFVSGMEAEEQLIEKYGLEI